MIGKVMTGKSFNGCISYCLENKIQTRQNDTGLLQKDRAEVLMYNLCYGNKKELIQQFYEVRQLNNKLSKPVMHITLSFAPGEQLGKNKLMEMAEHCAKDFGFEKNQFVVVAHNDTQHQHIHIVANRIGFDKRTVSDSNSYKKIATFCRKMEQQYRLQQVLNPRKYLAKEQRQSLRLDKRRQALKSTITTALMHSKNYQDFTDQMNQKGYRIIKSRGIAFVDNKAVKTKGSEVGYSLRTIDKILAQSPAEKYAMLRCRQPSKETLKEYALNRSIVQENHLDATASRLADILLKPQQNNMNTAGGLLIKKSRKKKRRGLHL